MLTLSIAIHILCAWIALQFVCKFFYDVDNGDEQQQQRKKRDNLALKRAFERVRDSPREQKELSMCAVFSFGSHGHQISLN